MLYFPRLIQRPLTSLLFFDIRRRSEGDFNRSWVEKPSWEISTQVPDANLRIKVINLLPASFRHFFQLIANLQLLPIPLQRVPKDFVGPSTLLFTGAFSNRWVYSIANPIIGDFLCSTFMTNPMGNRFSPIFQHPIAPCTDPLLSLYFILSYRIPFFIHGL